MSEVTAHHDLEHGAHHDDHHESSWLTTYIFSQDHKMIAKQFLVTGIFWAFIGGLLSLFFRLQLAWPNETFPILESLLGSWAEGGKLSNEFYYALVTMHGTILVFFVLTAGLSGTFANFLIPLQIGARDMASPLMNMLSYWFFFAASVVLFLSFFIQTGPASGGWTAYPPLNGMRDIAINKGSGLGFDMWIGSMTLFIVGSTLGSLNYVATVINMRTKGMSFTKMPLVIWALMFTAVLGILAFPALLAACGLLEFDRLLGTSFYLNNIVINGDLQAYKGGSPLIFQHLFWFLGHPEVYIIIFPAMGIVSEVLSVHAKKPVFGYKAMILSLGAILVIGFFVWAHHMFVTGMSPTIGKVFVIFTLLIAIPSAIKVFNWITTIWRGNLRFTPPMMFAIGFVSLFISGGITGIHLGNSTIDIQLHDSYFVVGHFHIVMGVAAFFGMWAGVYQWFPKMFGRFMNPTLGYIHFWGSIIGGYMVFFPMHFMAGVPRRYYAFDQFQSFNNFTDVNVFMTLAAFLVFAAQIVFLINFFYSMFKGKEMTEDNLNPWGANTLEWTTSVHPGHGNWEGDLPEVHRWPYDYSTNGKEINPQNMPLGEGEEAH
ncbi:MAG: cbb3-type cytochrome c oxidase subunit I [Chitinophagales bacterium]|nr:cbb3-type cytochrome c oxidase subunit I [Chitinophagales bacterium]